MQSQITQQADRISAVVTENGQVRAGIIIQAINGYGYASIKADRVNFDSALMKSSLITDSTERLVSRQAHYFHIVPSHAIISVVELRNTAKEGVKMSKRIQGIGTFVLVCLLFTLFCSCGGAKPQHFTAEEVVEALESEYEGDFMVIESSQENTKEVIYTVTNSLFPGLSFPVRSYISAASFYINCQTAGQDLLQPRPESRHLLYRYQYEAYLAEYLTERYQKEHDNLPLVTEMVVESSGRPSFCVRYYYETYATIEEDVLRVTAYGKYMQQWLPFVHNNSFKIPLQPKGTSNARGFDFGVSGVCVDSSGTTLRRQLVEQVQAECISFYQWAECGYEFLTEEQQEAYFEALAKKAEVNAINTRRAACEFSIYNITSLKGTFAESYGLRIGSVYVLCSRAGLPLSGNSWDFEVIAPNGSTYRFRYYFDDTPQTEYYYYKDGTAIQMPGESQSILPFTLIEEVLGYMPMEEYADTSDSRSDDVSSIESEVSSEATLDTDDTGSSIIG